MDNMDVSGQKALTRMSFLKHVLVGWSALIILPVLYAFIKYIIPPTLREQILEVLKVGSVADIPINSAKIVKFNKMPIVIVHTPEDQFKAFSAVCTHLGCIVEYKNDQKNFHCNCHGSVFDLNGKNIGGPAPKPLKPLRVELNEDAINILKS